MYKVETALFKGSETHQFTGGANLISAVIVLAIMILPTVINISESALRAVPAQYLSLIHIYGEAVGSIAVMLKDDVYCKSAELGYWLGEPFWRKGIMTRAVQQMCEEAFRRYKLVRIYAEPFSTNLASRGVLEKAGFQLEGIKRKSIFKNGCIQDSYLYAVIHV